MRATARWAFGLMTPRIRTRPPPANGFKWWTFASFPLRKSHASFAMFAPRWMKTAPTRQRRKNGALKADRICHAARAPTRTGMIEAIRNGARRAWNQSRPTGTAVGGPSGRLRPMNPTCFPSRITGYTDRTAWNVEPSFRISVTSSSNFPFTLASFRRRGTRVGTFRGTWKDPTFILPRTSWRVQPKRASASASYFWTVPCMSQTITEVSVVKGFPAIARFSRLRLPRRCKGPRTAHEPDLLAVPEHRADREDRGEAGPVFPHQGDLLLEPPLLDRGLQEPWHESRDVLREMERGDAHLADDLVRGPAEQVRRVRGVLCDGPLHVACDHGRLGDELLRLGHGISPCILSQKVAL